tara:strand:+ start:980 stop:1216 length:237 start_codon:yes stop_codon:yes gene_type:complete
MFKIIIFYELIFVVFWNVLYYGNGNFNSWVSNQFLTAAYVFLSTMALGLTLLYIIYISIKISGLGLILKKLKDPRKNN